MNNIESLQYYFSSELILIIGLIVLIILTFGRGKDEGGVAPIVVSLITLLLSLSAALSTHFEESLSLFHGMMAMDAFGLFFKILIMATALVTVVFSIGAADLKKTPRCEFFAFLLALTLGLNVMSSAHHLLMMYLAIEMASIVSYVLAGYMTGSKRSDEAALKYVLYGGAASGVMIFGMSLLYGLTGTLELTGIREACVQNATDPLILFLTFVLILAGLGYKMAIAPFHMWSPDVYEGAPLPVTAFLSVASKAAGFAITLRFLIVGFTIIEHDGTWSAVEALDWQLVVAVLSALTMTVGNVLALQQYNIKRFLAYSSIAHAGYLLMGVAVKSTSGIEGVIFYFIVYFLMNLGAFFVAGMVLNQRGTEDMHDYKGLIRQGPFAVFLSLTLSVFLFSLTGIPPFAGFVAKLVVFKAVIHSGLIWLAVIGAINSVISLYYYVRLIKFMLIDESPAKEVQPFSLTPVRHTVMVSAFCLLTLVFGLYFAPLARWAHVSVGIFH